MPKISVIMPVYNTKEEYLKIAMESILNQTFSDFEFIIINDGSTNNIEDIIFSYNDSRIVYIKQENQGIVSALNNGWEHAKGEYLARMDSDDISYPERFEKQIKFLEENPAYSLVGTQSKFIGKNYTTNLPTVVKIIDLLADCAFFHPTIMFRKADFDKYNLKYTAGMKCAEDYLLYSQAIKYLNMANLPDVLLEYRVYPENTSSKYRDARVKGSFVVQDLILDYISDDKKVREDILDIAYKQKAKTSKIKEKIFSVKNLYKNWEKYKLITFLGLEICIKTKDYYKE